MFGVGITLCDPQEMSNSNKTTRYYGGKNYTKEVFKNQKGTMTVKTGKDKDRL